MTEQTRNTLRPWTTLVAGLVQTVPDNFRQHFGRIAQFFEVIGKEVSDTVAGFNGRIETPQQLHDFIDSYIRQLDHLEDMASLQNAHLMHDGASDPTVLNMSIYTLSGMREQLTQDIGVFDRLMGTTPPSPLQSPDASTPAAPNTTAPAAAAPNATPSPPHPDHHYTKVVGILPTIPENISLFGRIRKWFNPNTQTTNADLARELAQVYRKFRDRARDVQQMFRLAEPKDLSEMYTPMDAMRSLRDLLSVEEMRFYQERTAVPVARRAAGD